MTIQECYAALGGDYEEVLGRLYSEALVKKFTGKFLADQSFQLLESSLNAEDFDEAFRAAHTLKGVSQNLSFTSLHHSSHAITEALRAKDYTLAARLFSSVGQDYERTVAAIQAFQASQPN